MSYEPGRVASSFIGASVQKWFRSGSVKVAEQGLAELRDQARLNHDANTEVMANLALVASRTAAGERSGEEGRLRLLLYSLQAIEKGAAAGMTPGPVAHSIYGCLKFGNKKTISEELQARVAGQLLETLAAGAVRSPEQRRFLADMAGVVGEPGKLFEHSDLLGRSPWEADAVWTATVGREAVLAERKAGREQCAARAALVALHGARDAAAREGDARALWHLQRYDQTLAGQPPGSRPWLALATLDRLACNLPPDPDSDLTLARWEGPEALPAVPPPPMLASPLKTDPRLLRLEVHGQVDRLLDLAGRSQKHGMAANRFRLRREVGEAIQAGGSDPALVRETWDRLEALDPARRPEERLIDGLDFMTYLDVDNFRTFGRLLIAELEAPLEGQVGGQFLARTRENLEQAPSVAAEWQIWRDFKQVFSEGTFSEVQTLLAGLKADGGVLREDAGSVTVGGVILPKQRRAA